MIIPARFKTSPLSAYSSPTSDYKETESRAIDLSVSTPLKKGDLVIWAGDGKTCVKATGDFANGVLTAGEFDYKLTSWTAGNHVQICQRGKKIIPASDLPAGIKVGESLTVKAGVWAKAAPATATAPADKVFGVVGKKQSNGFDVDLFFLG